VNHASVCSALYQNMTHNHHFFLANFIIELNHKISSFNWTMKTELNRALKTNFKVNFAINFTTMRLIRIQLKTLVSIFPLSQNLRLAFMCKLEFLLNTYNNIDNKGGDSEEEKHQQCCCDGMIMLQNRNTREP
jgi:hypothetical protein